MRQLRKRLPGERRLGRLRQVARVTTTSVDDIPSAHLQTATSGASVLFLLSPPGFEGISPGAIQQPGPMGAESQRQPITVKAHGPLHSCPGGRSEGGFGVCLAVLGQPRVLSTTMGERVRLDRKYRPASALKFFASSDLTRQRSCRRRRHPCCPERDRGCFPVIDGGSCGERMEVCSSVDGVHCCNIVQFHGRFRPCICWCHWGRSAAHHSLAVRVA